MLAPEKKRLKEQTVIWLDYAGAHDEIGKVYHELKEWAARNKVKLTGPGFTVFLGPPSEFDPSSALFEVCMPVAPTTKGDAKVRVKKLPAMTVAAAQVKGPYSQIPAHYTEMLAWLDAEGWDVAGPPREVYLKRPDAAGKGDPNEFVTEIQFPVKS
jgi:effector-binding domain-containing protein